MDCGNQCNELFDQRQQDHQLFICRIKASTKKKILSQNLVPADSIVFFDAMVLLGTPEVNQSQTPLRVVGYEVDNVKYWIATDRFDLSAEQIAQDYKLRWDIESFFAWWKRHLKVYHLIARNPYGILSGLITYLLLAILKYATILTIKYSLFFSLSIKAIATHTMEIMITLKILEAVVTFLIKMILVIPSQYMIMVQNAF